MYVLGAQDGAALGVLVGGTVGDRDQGAGVLGI